MVVLGERASVNTVVYDLKVQDLTELLYKLQLMEFESHFRRIKEYNGTLIWVSALTQCPKKWEFMLRFPEASQVQFKGSFVLGKAAHVGLQQLLQSYYTALGYEKIEIEEEIEKKLVLSGGREVLLTGRVDAVAYRGDEKVIYEVKTARSDMGLPHEHHLLQLKIYMNMAGSSTGVLVYLTPDRVAEYYVTNPISDEELAKLVEEFLEFNGPRYDWECSYCVYSVLCPLKKTNTRR